jgi:arginyl-tRNA synthetase
VNERLRAELSRVASRLGADGLDFVLERPRDAGHGDLATNLAMVLARRDRVNPRKTAELVLQELQLPAGLVDRTEIAGPGFINFWLAETQLASEHRRILDEGREYGRSTWGAGLRVNVEFVSANPTGPLHVGHGRGAALGDAIASLLQWTGHSVTREFYVNDAGGQIDKLAQSLWARVRAEAGYRDAQIPEGGYHGEYLVENAREVLSSEGRTFADLPEAEGLRRTRQLAVGIQRAEQDRDLEQFGVRFDVTSSEQASYDSGRVERALALLAERGLTFESEGALWLRTTGFGDDKDRVLRKSDGTLTYLAPDIAYHIDKHDRGFDRVVDVWGADHHGYIPRLRAALAALGYPPEFFDVALVQLVKVMRGGEEVKMSKRSGEFVTLRDLYEEVGVDAARFFFLALPGDTQMTFNVDLAKKQTDENPVFYVQMAHARLSGIFRTAERDPDSIRSPLDLAALAAPQDMDLLKKLIVFPEIVEKAARERAPHRVTVYLRELATAVHAWYHHTRAVGAPEGENTELARLLLARAARIVLANGLTLLGISAPDRM